MPRIIGAERNELIVDDKISGSQLGLYYRTPTTSERQAYLNAAIKRHRNKVTMHHAEARMKYGMAILTGVRDGDFMRMQDGKAVAMSSDPAGPNYYPEWKREIEGGCGDLVMLLAAVVFDGGAEIAQADNADEPGEDIAGE